MPISTAIDRRESRDGVLRELLFDSLLLVPESSMPGSIARRWLAEFIGTALLVIAVIGSGIAASRLSPGNVGLQLFENAAATGAALVAIILAVGPVSGAHLNPAITLLDRLFGGISNEDTIAYVGAQLAGGICGACIANLMFDLDGIQISTKTRSGGGLWLGEVVATFGLALVIFGLARSRRQSLLPFAVGSYIAAAYFFTSSTSFANPAVTVARMFSNTFAGIAPRSVEAFVAFQLAGAATAGVAIRFLYPDVGKAAGNVVVSQEDSARREKELME
jgi:glycerol uptake facilitator-like aquaporin